MMVVTTQTQTLIKMAKLVRRVNQKGREKGKRKTLKEEAEIPKVEKAKTEKARESLKTEVERARMGCLKSFAIKSCISL